MIVATMISAIAQDNRSTSMDTLSIWNDAG